jgi:hypothetical protein
MQYMLIFSPVSKTIFKSYKSCDRAPLTRICTVQVCTRIKQKYYSKSINILISMLRGHFFYYRTVKSIMMIIDL